MNCLQSIYFIIENCQVISYVILRTRKCVFINLWASIWVQSPYISSKASNEGGSFVGIPSNMHKLLYVYNCSMSFKFSRIIHFISVSLFFLNYNWCSVYKVINMQKHLYLYSYSISFRFFSSYCS